MAVDYMARKAAKKGRKHAEELKPRRERKKKQNRRLCRGKRGYMHRRWPRMPCALASRPRDPRGALEGQGCELNMPK